MDSFRSLTPSENPEAVWSILKADSPILAIFGIVALEILDFSQNQFETICHGNDFQWNFAQHY
jgi:hypothetical protein